MDAVISKTSVATAPPVATGHVITGQVITSAWWWDAREIKDHIVVICLTSATTAKEITLHSATYG
jgi:hypothetical protein